MSVLAATRYWTSPQFFSSVGLTDTASIWWYTTGWCRVAGCSVLSHQSLEREWRAWANCSASLQDILKSPCAAWFLCTASWTVKRENGPDLGSQRFQRRLLLVGIAVPISRHPSVPYTIKSPKWSQNLIHSDPTYVLLSSSQRQERINEQKVRYSARTTHSVLG